MSKETELITRILNFYADSDKEFSIFQCESWLKEYAKEYHEAETLKAFKQTGPMFLRSTGVQFTEIPALMFNPKESDLMGKEADDCELIEVVKMIDASRIEQYAETIPSGDFRDDNKIWTNVVMQSGDNFTVNMPLKDFEKLIHPTI